MKIALYLALTLAIIGQASSAWTTAIGSEPAKWPGARQAQITQAPKDIVSLIGNQAQITAIRGNMITIKNLNDPSKTVTVNVDNVSLFKVGQRISVSEKLLTPQ